MHIDLQKHHVNYLTPIVEARIRVLKNRILKEKKDDWYDYEPAQIELKICEISTSRGKRRTSTDSAAPS